MNRTLFEPFEIGPITIKNRFVRSATFEGMATSDGRPTASLKELYQKLAEGEVGLIISGCCFVESYSIPEIPGLGYPLTIHDDRFIADWKVIVTAVHQGGAKIAMQVSHAGRQDDPGLREPIAPSVVPLEYSLSIPREMREDEIHAMVEKFAQAGRRAWEAGFDAVQLHGGHGYLISNFLSPYTNRRTDRYGGSTENRARFALEIIARIRELTGPDFPILIKLNCDDFIEGGITKDEAVKLAKLLDAGGIAAIEVTGGIKANIPSRTLAMGINKPEKEAYFKAYAQALKAAVGVPVILVGGIRSPGVAEAMIRDGYADMIALCRALIREPGLVKRWRDGDLKKAQCISCNKCHDTMFIGALRCSVTASETGVESNQD